MPLSFPNLDSLKNYFGRSVLYEDGETEESYRERCAVHSEQTGDHVQAMEVRSKKPWDRWTGDDQHRGVGRILNRRKNR